MGPRDSQKHPGKQLDDSQVITYPTVLSDSYPVGLHVLQGVVDMFILSRTAEEVDLMAPRRDTAINLYDYFGGSD